MDAKQYLRDEEQPETCLKPIGELAQLIEAMSFEDFARLMVALSKQSAE